MLTIWIKIVALFRRFFYLKRIEKQGIDPNSLHGLLGQLELLRPEYFQFYTTDTGQKVVVKLYSKNVTVFFATLNVMLEQMRNGAYFDVPLLSNKPELTQMTLDGFLLTARDRFPVSPLEMIAELTEYLTGFDALLYPNGKQHPNVSYYLRKSSWVFHDIQVLTEALFEAVKRT